MSDYPELTTLEVTEIILQLCEREQLSLPPETVQWLEILRINLQKEEMDIKLAAVNTLRQLEKLILAPHDSLDANTVQKLAADIVSGMRSAPSPNTVARDAVPSFVSLPQVQLRTGSPAAAVAPNAAPAQQAEPSHYSSYYRRPPVPPPLSAAYSAQSSSWAGTSYNGPHSPVASISNAQPGLGTSSHSTGQLDSNLSQPMKQPQATVPRKRGRPRKVVQ